MDSSFPTAQARLLAYEGGYSNHPADPGGVTLEGITQKVYCGWRASVRKACRTLTAAMRYTPEWIAERDTIYRQNYWLPPRCDVLPAGVDAAIYDYSVNSGIGRARKVLQRLVGVKDDGVIGPVTLEAVAKRDPKELVKAICAERLAFLKTLKTWPVFGKGWGARVADVEAYSTALATSAAVASVPKTSAPSVAKGEVAEATKTKAVVKGGPVVAAGGAGVSWTGWIAAHPFVSVAIAVGAIAAVVGVIAIINRRHKARQEAPTPGIGVVPEMKG